MNLRSLLATLALVLATGMMTTANADEPVRLVTGHSVSADGSRLVFSWAGDIWLAPTAGGTAERLTLHPSADSQPCFSPDGDEVAFVSRRTGSPQVFTVPVTGGAPQQHSFHTEGYVLEEYSPKGDAFLVRGMRDHFWRDGYRFFRLERENKTAEQLIFDAAGYDGRLSPDGRRILFTREGTSWYRKGYEGSQAAQIWLYDLESGEFQELLDDVVGFRYPRWKPDGTGFYYVGQQSGAFNIWECAIDGGERRQLTFYDDDGVHDPAVSRDGSTIVFRHLFDLYRFDPVAGTPPERIEIVNSGEPVATDVQRRNLTDTRDVAFTDDGLEIAFVAGGDVWVMDTELREPRRVTATPEEERSVVFSPDGERLYFVSDAGGQTDVWVADRKEEDQFWWQNARFALDKITDDAATENYLEFVPTTGRLAFIRGRGDLVTTDAEGKDAQTHFEGWSAPDFVFSPDGQWIAYAAYDNDFNKDIWVAPVDGTQPPFNLSVHPDNDRGPAWSPDGKVIAWTGRRANEETDIYYVQLRKEDFDEDSRDRKLQKALDKMKKRKGAAAKGAKGSAAKTSADAKKSEKRKTPRVVKGHVPSDEQRQAAAAAKAKRDGKKPEPTADDKSVVIDFDGLRDRIRSISIRDSRESTLRWISDRKLVFDASIDGTSGAYSVEFPDSLRPKKFSSTRIRGSRYLSGAKSLAMVSGGQPATVSSSGAVTRYSFTARQQIDPRERYRAAFAMAWRAMRDGYYDENLGNRNWDAVRRKYIEAATNAIDDRSFARVVQLMLGELNGSHLGFTAGGRRGGSAPAPTQQWNELTGHLGLRYDANYRGPGWRVEDVIEGGPASDSDTRIEPGEVILAIDGTAVDPSIPVSEVLNGFMARDVEVRVRGVDKKERTVTLRPTTYAGIRRRLYDRWLEHNREVVDEATNGALGYLHVRGMNWSSFLKFELELYKVGAGKDGLIIDVRANGGGSTADHLLTVLTQPRHAFTVPRGGGVGYPQDRRVYATWHKPIVVLCDQDSFSNAEIFAHAIKTLERGHVIGMPTAGGVISTGGRSIMDVGYLRMPFRGWFLLDGEDMELNGTVPHFLVDRAPGDWPAGRDPQLAKAIEVLLDDVAEWKANPTPTPRRASERRETPVRRGGRTVRF